jgi:Flp pilus assembly protein TadG
VFTFVLKSLVRQFQALERRATDERGMALVLYALTLIPMLGMVALVVDAGIEFGRKTRMQAAVDAAVLAAAPELGTGVASELTLARNKAKELAAANGYPLADADIVFSTSPGSPVPNDVITVTRSQTDNLIFARALGINTATPSVMARARVFAVGGRGGIVPFGIEPLPGGAPFVSGAQYCLKLQARPAAPCGGVALIGNFQALNVDVGENGAAPYEDDIINGSDNPLKIGDIRNIAQGAVAGPTRQGVGCGPPNSVGRLTGNTETFAQVLAGPDPEGRYDVLRWSSPRLILIPVVSYPTAQTAMVESFAGFFLESCAGAGNNTSVTGRFVELNWTNAEATALTNGNNHGSRTIRLVD